MRDIEAWFSLQMGLFGGAADTVALWLFLAAAAVYFLAPAAGYGRGGRGALGASMILLIIQFGLSAANFTMHYLMSLDSSPQTRPDVEFLNHMTMIYFIMKHLLLVGAMITFVVGMYGLRHLKSESPQGA
jgi:hypothetical protein